jgi:vancomycin resistance protein YoaR
MASDMGILELVSSSRSFFRGSGDARLNNIAVGGATMHGVLVAPGELFSFNSFLGDVSLDTGFAEAWIIFGGRTIQGVGGGICQVSTTVYRAALFGGYPIDERNPHAYRVAYYEQGDDSPGPGLDATVFKPIADFQFTNDRDAWLLINVEVDEDDGWITFRFFSTDDGRSVTVDPPLVSNVVEPEPPIYEENPDLETGMIEQVDWAASGADVSVYRVVQRNGEVLFDEEIVTRYQSWQAVYQYGIGTQLPQDAIP